MHYLVSFLDFLAVGLIFDFQLFKIDHVNTFGRFFFRF